MARTSDKVRAAFAVDDIDIRLLRIFMAVAAAGGFSAAQDDLNQSLASISEKISALEQRLGMKLCRRGRAGFALTENGRVVYEEGQRLLGNLTQFSQRMAGLRNHLSGVLSIGVVDNVIVDPNLPLSKAVADFLELAPSVHINLEVGSPETLLRGVVAQKLHLAIGSFPRASLGLSYLDLYDEQQNIYCGRDHPLYDVADDEIDINTVRVHRIIARSYWAGRDIKIFAIASPHATVSNMEAEAHLVLSGAFLGYLPSPYAAQFVAAGRMRAICPQLFAYKAKFQIAASEGWNKRATPKTFIDCLLKATRSVKA